MKRRIQAPDTLTTLLAESVQLNSEIAQHTRNCKVLVERVNALGKRFEKLSTGSTDPRLKSIAAGLFDLAKKALT